MPRFVFADVVRILDADETSVLGIAGHTGMVVATKVPVGSGEIIGGGDLTAAVLVSLDEPHPDSILIASRLLEATGEKANWEVVDGRTEQ